MANLLDVLLSEAITPRHSGDIDYELRKGNDEGSTSLSFFLVAAKYKWHFRYSRSLLSIKN